MPVTKHGRLIVHARAAPGRARRRPRPTGPGGMCITIIPAHKGPIRKIAGRSAESRPPLRPGRRRCGAAVNSLATFPWPRGPGNFRMMTGTGMSADPGPPGQVLAEAGLTLRPADARRPRCRFAASPGRPLSGRTQGRHHEFGRPSRGRAGLVAVPAIPARTIGGDRKRGRSVSRRRVLVRVTRMLIGTLLHCQHITFDRTCNQHLYYSL
jgi:hypothetical protein